MPASDEAYEVCADTTGGWDDASLPSGDHWVSVADTGSASESEPAIENDAELPYIPLATEEGEEGEDMESDQSHHHSHEDEGWATFEDDATQARNQHERHNQQRRPTRRVGREVVLSQEKAEQIKESMADIHIHEPPWASEVDLHALVEDVLHAHGSR